MQSLSRYDVTGSLHSQSTQTVEKRQAEGVLSGNQRWGRYRGQGEVRVIRETSSL